MLYEPEPGSRAGEDEFALGEEKQVAIGIRLKLPMFEFGAIGNIDEVGQASCEPSAVRSRRQDDASGNEAFGGLLEQPFGMSDVLDHLPEDNGGYRSAPEWQILERGGEPPGDGWAVILPSGVAQEGWSEVDCDGLHTLFRKRDGDVRLRTCGINDEARRCVCPHEIDHYLETTPVG